MYKYYSRVSMKVQMKFHNVIGNYNEHNIFIKIVCKCSNIFMNHCILWNGRSNVVWKVNEDDPRRGTRKVVRTRGCKVLSQASYSYIQCSQWQRQSALRLIHEGPRSFSRGSRQLPLRKG